MKIKSNYITKEISGYFSECILTIRPSKKSRQDLLLKAIGLSLPVGVYWTESEFNQLIN